MQNLIKIEKLTNLGSSDFAEIFQIEQMCFLHPWTEKMFQISENEFIVVVRTMKRISAYLCCQRILNECHILNVAVHPEMRGIGLAKQLLKWLIVPENGDEYYLEVRRTNVEAIGLYEKFGFEIIGTRPKYYQNGEDALVMMRQVCN